MNRRLGIKIIKALSVVAVIALTALFTQANAAPDTTPKVIPNNVSCGKCGMFPANYPQWQAEIIFKDGKMTPFDGCKCLFGFLFDMGKYDQAHTAADVAAIWVKDFNTGTWINAKEAHYVVGSDVMGPMGKELIPFAEASAADTFQKEHGGQIAMYHSISRNTLKPLMGKMDMKGKMKMGGKMDMNKKMNDAPPTEGQMNK